MQLIIDTQAILWFQNADTKLSKKAKDLILNKTNVCFVSIVSLWEIAIKVNLKKLKIGMDFRDFPEYLIDNNFEILNLKFSHLNLLSELGNHHRDPFDRLIIAQAITEDMTVVSSDQHFQAYAVRVDW
jgi:PIN domain nuclease of toxin-antitoxin system